MGFDLVLISTEVNSMKVPKGAICCFCRRLVDEGIALSGCGHSACYKCMTERAAKRRPVCALDGEVYVPDRYQYLPQDVEEWLNKVKLKCRWFDGHNCTATGLAVHNVRRHEIKCRNRPGVRVQDLMKEFEKGCRVTGGRRVNKAF